MNTHPTGADHPADAGAARYADATRAVRAGLPEPVKNEPTLPGPVFAAHFHLPGEVSGPYTYGRDTNPTWTLLERAIGELEAPGQDGVDTVVFASGMAAVSAVLLSQARTGDTVVLPDDGYQALPLVREQLQEYGIHVRTAPTAEDAQLAALDGARLLWIETPSNPGLDVCDVRRLVAAARAGGTLVAVDNTLATPSASVPWNSARTSPSPAAPRASPATATCSWATSSVATPHWPRASAAGARSSARSRAPWRPGSPTAPWPPSSCGPSASGATPWRSPRRWPTGPR